MFVKFTRPLIHYPSRSQNKMSSGGEQFPILTVQHKERETQNCLLLLEQHSNISTEVHHLQEYHRHQTI